MSVAILVNPRACHGSTAIGDEIRALIPDARVAVTGSLEELSAWVRDTLSPHPPELLLSGGGDGTAVTLLNELRRQDVAIPTFGLLPLGTGNGWARSSGGTGRRAAMRGLRALRPKHHPARAFNMVETEGLITPFAGVGWDAQILADYAELRAETPAGVQRLGGSKLGYLRSIATRSIPKQLRQARPNVRIVNLGEPAMTVDRHGSPVPIEGGGAGAVLYEGPLSTCGASTTEELGFGFRGFAFAHLIPGRLQVRVYAAGPLGAAARLPWLWRGAHPLPDDHHFFVTRCRFEFDRAVPFEIGGDLVGERTSVEMALAEDAVSLLDWRKLC